MEGSTRPNWEFFVNLAKNGINRAIPKTIVAPLERVQLLLQVQGELIKSGRLQTPYKGPIDCALRVIAEEGVLSLWRGNLVNVLLYIPTQIANYVFSDIIQKVTPKYNREKDGYVKWLLGNMAAGALGAMTSLVYFPLTYAQTRLVTDIKPENAGGEYQFNNLFDVFRKTWASDGIGGHYRGFLESILGIVVYRGCYFAFYDFLKPLVLTGSSKDSFAATFLLGWGTTVAAGLVSYPFGTIQRRMMMTSCEPDKNKYSSFWHCASFIWENEGVSSFFKGAGLHIIRGVCGALVTTGMNSIHYYMMKRSS